MSNFTFSHIVFKRLVLQTRKNQGLFGKRLKHQNITNCIFSTMTKKNIQGRGQKNNSYNKQSVFSLQVALQILGRKFYKNTKKSSLYSKSLLHFIYKTPVSMTRHLIKKMDFHKENMCNVQLHF